VTLDFTIGLGTALLVAVLALLLLRGRFGKRAEAPRSADPAERWLRSDTTETPPTRDGANPSTADDPGQPGGDGNGDGPDAP
jgi:hypothetical protein